jgi:phage replication-related protein YjqB (UPF0714/DUF867 family)
LNERIEVFRVGQDKYKSFAALAAAEKRGTDYDFDCRRVPAAAVAVIAPHGGYIEPRTDEIASRICEADFSFYAFRGLKPGSELHIASHRFDEPNCVGLVATHERAVSVHGWGETRERVCIGGRDTELIDALKTRLAAAGVEIEDAVGLLRGTDPQNIVNRCGSGRGVQFELTMRFRTNREATEAFVRSVRTVLAELQRPRQR